MVQQLGAEYDLPTDRERIAADAASMREAGLGFVYLGAGLWDRLCPQSGTFDAAFLLEAMSTLHAAGIMTRLVVPFDPPRWFGHPTAALPRAPRRALSGALAEEGIFYSNVTCVTDPEYRAALDLFVVQLAKAVADSKAMAGWAISLPPEPCGHCPHCLAEWRSALQRDFSAPADAARSWGLSNPEAVISWDVFLPHEGTSGMWLHWRLHMEECAGRLATHIETLLTGAGVAVPVARVPRSGETRILTGAAYTLLRSSEDGWQPAMLAIDRVLSSATDCHAAGLPTGDDLSQQRPHAEYPLPQDPLQIRLEALSTILHGARTVAIDAWRRPAAGPDQFGGGALEADGTPRDTWEALRQTAKDLERMADCLPGYAPQCDVLILDDPASAMLARFNLFFQFDRPSHVAQLYGILRRFGCAIRVVEQLPDSLPGYRLIVVPAKLVDDPAVSARLADYVRVGGCLLTTMLTGVTDRHGATGPEWPMSLTETLGIRIRQWKFPKPGETIKIRLAGRRDDRTDRETPRPETGVWFEQVFPLTGRTLWEYAGYPLDGYPALTHNKLGTGDAFHAAARGTPALWEAVLTRHVLPSAGLPAAILPEGVELIRFTSKGGPGTAVINHRGKRVDLTLEGRWRDVVSGNKVKELRHLRPYDMVVLLDM